MIVSSSRNSLSSDKSATTAPRAPRTSTLPLRALFGIASLVLGICAAAPSAVAQLTSPTQEQQTVARQIALYLERVHIRNHEVDDDVSKRFLDSYLKTLDPQRLFFLESDIREFEASRLELDDWLKEGRYDFAITVFNRFLERLASRVEKVDQLVEAEHDFSIEEKMLKDRKSAPWATSIQELDEEWRKFVKYLLLQGIANEEPEAEVREQIRRRYSSLLKRMRQTDTFELIEMYVTAGTTTFDPHTTYMSPDTLESFEISMRLELEGIGAALQSIDGYTTVSQIIPGGAAARDGRLQPNDKILAVGQDQEGELVDVVDMKLRDVVRLIRGKKGTFVRLRVLHEVDNSKELLVLERAQVVLADREARSDVIEAGTKPDGSTYQIGVIDLPSFYMDMNAARLGIQGFKSTSRDVRKILEDFKAKGVDAVVVDLRANGGGALSEAIEMTGLFIDEGPVVQIKDPTGSIEREYDREAGMAWDGPLVVLTSRFSASASEIFAGAIQDYARGLVIGDVSTHGKGTVQRLVDLGRRSFSKVGEKLGALKITISQFYRPTGASTQSRGVVPDITLPSIKNHMEIGESTLEYAIEFDTIPSAEFERLQLVTPEIVAKLREASEKRRSQDEGFVRLEKDIARYLQIKSKKWAPLRKDDFLAEYKAGEAAEEDAIEEAIEQPGDDRPVVVRDFYFDEVLAITVDLLRLAS